MLALQGYLTPSSYIDWQDPEVLALAKSLGSQGDTARRCFEFVRDEIDHSWDHKKDPVTCKASDVLRHRTGYCYAKSHLLAALLRANGIPAGLCYQRTVITDEASGYCLHGLNAIYLEEYGWYKVDARGNKPGVDAQFCPPQERLAFATIYEGEKHFAEVFSEPHPLVIDVLTRNHSYQEVADQLPDAIEL